MVQNKVAALLIFCAASTVVICVGAGLNADDDNWIEYAQAPNGDVYFFDRSRVDRADKSRTVWIRVRYKTSVMAASSFQSRLEVDCAARTERVLQSTFFTDKQWKTRAMNTNMNPKPKRSIVVGSATDDLAEMICP